MMPGGPLPAASASVSSASAAWASHRNQFHSSTSSPDSGYLIPNGVVSTTYLRYRCQLTLRVNAGAQESRPANATYGSLSASKNPSPPAVPSTMACTHAVGTVNDSSPRRRSSGPADVDVSVGAPAGRVVSVTSHIVDAAACVRPSSARRTSTAADVTVAPARLVRVVP